MIHASEIKQQIKPIDYYSKLVSHLSASSTQEWLTIPCVFHNDRNPSLSINVKSGGYYCHGCGEKGGDIIQFEMGYHSISFREAIEKLSLEWRI